MMVIACKWSHVCWMFGMSDLMCLAVADDSPPLGQPAWPPPCGTGTTGYWSWCESTRQGKCQYIAGDDMWWCWYVCWVLLWRLVNTQISFHIPLYCSIPHNKYLLAYCTHMCSDLHIFSGNDITSGHGFVVNYVHTCIYVQHVVVCLISKYDFLFN